jgi:hydroxyacylglutathione hydrolase
MEQRSGGRFCVSDPFTEIAPGVLVATGVLYTTTTTVVAGPDGSCLVVDPAVTVAEIAGLAAALAARGLRPVLGWSTHPHWDHVLWHASLGDVPRYATPAAVAAARNEHDTLAAAAGKSAPGHDFSLLGKMTPLSGTSIPWDGPSAEPIDISSAEHLSAPSISGGNPTRLPRRRRRGAGCPG